jgi:hypothetical protein
MNKSKVKSNTGATKMDNTAGTELKHYSDKLDMPFVGGFNRRQLYDALVLAYLKIIDENKCELCDDQNLNTWSKQVYDGLRLLCDELKVTSYTIRFKLEGSKLCLDANFTIDGEKLPIALELHTRSH